MLEPMQAFSAVIRARRRHPGTPPPFLLTPSSFPRSLSLFSRGNGSGARE